jgi:hypothetical protein
VRSRRHVITVRLSDGEYDMYRYVLRRAILAERVPSIKTDSDAFRVVLHRVYLDSM